MSILKRYLVGFGFSMIGLFGGAIVVYFTALMNSLWVYLLLIGFPMIFIASKKGSGCVTFHTLTFTVWPLAILFLKDFIISPVRVLILWTLASLAMYHIAVIYARYRRHKRLNKEVLGRN